MSTIENGSGPTYLIFSLAGFTDGLSNMADEGADVELVDLPRIYSGASPNAAAPSAGAPVPLAGA